MATRRGWQPDQRRIDDIPAAPFRLELLGARGIPPDRIVVGLESLVKAEASVEDVGADERGRPVAGVAECRRQRAALAVEDDAVLADAMRRRRQARHDRDVRWQRQRRRRANIGIRGAARREPVDVRGQTATDAIGAQRVDRDQDDVELTGSRGWWARTGSATRTMQQQRTQRAQQKGRCASHERTPGLRTLTTETRSHRVFG